MKNPSLFIVGAPKCGTSALATYLGEHPRVFMCPGKEPHYFADDFPSLKHATNLDEYLGLFRGATDDEVVWGEASVNYLYSQSAIPNIHAFNPDAKVIVLLRNPVDQAYSQHSQLLFGLYEDEPDFEKAWALQEARAAGNRIPKTCSCPEVLQYFKAAQYSEQLERLFSVFPQEQVRVFLTDDLKNDARDVYVRSLTLAGVEPDERTHFPHINENKVARSDKLAQLTERPPEAWVQGARLIRRALGVERIGLLNRLRDINKRFERRQALRPEFRAQLVEAFAPDVQKLQTMLGRDLGIWMEPGREATVH